ncbi:uncharacterized protein [Mytilus edulis]|uniref:uncharacterized protein n=1 Tax=Mytilus edulis TaxID=6550 RepID=UPI0039F0A6BD
MDSLNHQLQNECLQTAVACLLGEVRYHCSVIRDFELPSNFTIQDPKIHVKRKKKKSDSRLKRNIDKERKRKERQLLKQREQSTSIIGEPSSSRFQKLYEKDDRYRENKKAYSRERYSSDVPCQIAKKQSKKQKYKSNIQLRQAHNDYIKKKYRENVPFKDACKDYIKNKYKSNIQFREGHKEYIKNKYKANIEFRQAHKDYIKNRYKSNILFKKSQKDYIKNKYKANIKFRQAQKDYIKNRYKSNIQFKQIQKNCCKKRYVQFQLAIRERYASDKDFQLKLKTSSLLRYRQNVLFREKCKLKLRDQYKRELRYREKKILLVQKRRTKCVDDIAAWFRQQVRDGPSYICAVCIKLKFRKQVVELDKDKYDKKDKQSAAVANKCITCQFKSDCTDKCPIKCPTISHKLWICYTCHRHLLKGKIPADASANGLQLPTIPVELKSLNLLEKQLISLRIPFMKLVQLPKGNQRGIIGPCVSVPTDVQKTVQILPRSDDETQVVRCKLKRKQSYIGYCQYAFVSTKKICKGIECLKERNPLYKDIAFNDKWRANLPPDFEDMTAAEEGNERHSEISKVQDETKEHEHDKQQEGENVHVQGNESNPEILEEVITTESDKEQQLEEVHNIKDRGFPSDTCLQPVDIGQEILDQHFDDIFCVAPGEGSTPVSMMTEVGNEAMSFPAQFPEGLFGSFDNNRSVHLTRTRYFHARLLSGDMRFSTDSSYIFYAQYLSELEQVISKVSIALRKSSGKDTAGNNITASMLTDRNQLKSLLSTDQGYKFLTPIRGTPPYWQSVLKGLLATIRQLGIPTWFATFSAADMRWSEIINLLMKQQQSTQSFDDLDWTAKSEILRLNPVMNAVMFDHRFHTFLKEIIIKRSIVGKVKDHFHRIEFQQRGSPHAHCLFWIEDAPLLDKADDQTVCDFVDKYVTCELPDNTVDPELHEIVSSVQQHSKHHTKSCKKKGTTCRFHFPRPPSEKTFISRRQSLADPQLKKPPQQLKDHAQSVLHNLWTIINNENLGDITTDRLFAAAGITQKDLEDASNILTKRNTVTLKRSPSDLWINQYNPDLLRCWNANMDIQFITDAYSCVMYIISYISKAEREMGIVLENASKEAAAGNCGAQQAMKKIGGAYFRQREVSAQEAVYRVCGLHLKESSRKVQFVPVGENQVKMSLPLNMIMKKAEQLQDNDIWMLSLYDRYKARPVDIVFENVCYASFCSEYRVLSPSQIPKHPIKCQVYKLQNEYGCIQKRSRTDSAVIKYPRFSQEKYPELHFHANLQLFLPHRLESQLKPIKFKSYEEMFMNGFVILPPAKQAVSVKSIVDTNRLLFEQNVEDLDEAEELLQAEGTQEDAWALIAPEAEAERLDGELSREELYEKEIEIEIPELDTASRKTNKGHDIEIRQTLFPGPQMKTFIQQLNTEQRGIFYRIRQWCIDKVNSKDPEPFRVFINGGAGTGKSHLIKCIYYEMNKILSPHSANPDDIVVLLTAPTATAAYNIGGTTLHQAFSLPKSLHLPYIYLRDDAINKLRSKLQNLSILIIDEISMVGQPVLLYISERLRQIKQSRNALFGNICVIAVGDFYQLPPVKQKSLYNLKPDSQFPLWSSNFSIVELKQIMRQKDDIMFAQLLNRLRVKKKSDSLRLDDQAILKSCEQHTVPPETLHIFGTNKEVALHNNQMIESVCAITQTINALDYDKHPQTGKLKVREVPYETSYDFLPAHLVIGPKARVMLLRNVDLACGLVNGAMGTVTNVLPPKPGFSSPQGVMVLFDNKKIGHGNKQSTSEHQATIITMFEENLEKNAVRYQFPLQLSWACTIHKVQGITTDKAVVSLKHIFAAGMTYVALSRVTSMAGLVIKDFDEKHIYCNEQIGKALEQMPQFLTVKDRTIEQNEMVVVLHNIQGLIPHINDIRANSDISNANIICLTETWLENKTLFPSLDGYNFLHKDRYSSYPSEKAIFQELQQKKHGGVGIYVGNQHQCCPLTLDSMNIECLVIYIKEINANLVLVYKPETYTTSVFLQELHAVLISIPLEDVNTSTIVLGDFNQDILKTNSSIKEFMAIQGFAQIVSKPTTDGDTLIDHVYLNGNLKISVEVMQTYYSYHNMVSLRIKLPTL